MAPHQTKWSQPAVSMKTFCCAVNLFPTSFLPLTTIWTSSFLNVFVRTRLAAVNWRLLGKCHTWLTEKRVPVDLSDVCSGLSILIDQLLTKCRVSVGLLQNGTNLNIQPFQNKHFKVNFDQILNLCLLLFNFWLCLTSCFSVLLTVFLYLCSD